MTDPTPEPPDPADAGADADVGRDADDRRRLGRRAFLRRAGVGGAAVLGGGLGAHELVPHGQAAASAAELDGRQVRGAIGAGGGPADLVTGRADGYGAMVEPPSHLRADALAHLTVPPPRDARPAGARRDVELVVTEQHLQLGDGVVYDGWVYNGSAPGPIVRVTEGDRLRVRLVNRTSHAHNVHFHGRHSPQADGWEPVPPGGQTVYELTAAPFGVHPYHCHTPPLAEHIARGLYGAFIVDPPGGRPDAHEFVLVLSGWDLDGDGRNELYTWNGVAGFFHRFPIEVPVGEPVRCYVLNLTEHDPVASFHLHAQTFDLTWQGTSLEPDIHVDTFTMSQGDRAIVEFTLPERGRYMFHPHQHHMADRGAMGWFAAI